ncbi:MAG: ATP-binding protein [Xylanivirga thermophila]|uniref:sensor histidine kinase n=1 Tax=Xylanivirga thermophila TaxID=2496273 RepID=UPI00101E067E|nr:HAMP domain-containing sensor histidine kinase [Xylanivirga thermophila]
MPINRSFFSSLRWKIALAYLVIIGVGFIIINVSVMEIFEKDMLNDRKASFQKYAIEVAQSVSKGYFNAEPDVIYDIQELGEEITRKEGESTRILVLNANGIVDYDSYNDIGPSSLLKQDLKKYLPELEQVLSGSSIDAKDLYIIGENPSVKKRVLYSYAPISYENYGVIGMVFISSSLSSLEELLMRTRNMLNLYSIIISISIIILSFVISSFITQPINELTNVINKMSQGHLDQRVDIRGSAELKQLGEAFNIMSEKLESLDKTRNEFVSNASHELKTPLSSIKVLTESLLQMNPPDPDIYTEFLNDINNEIDRLNAIITDLLTLVRMDSGEASIKKEDIDIKELVQKSTKGLQLLAKKRDIDLEVFYDDNDLLIEGEPVKIQQVITNIVDNAIKYTPEGGRVWIDVYRGLDKAIIKVADTGVGIPQEDLTHIFDRFFRVDKARSRVTGGTGLGLSIAHKIVLSHGGNIHVSSTEGKGTTFYIELPLK